MTGMILKTKRGRARDSDRAKIGCGYKASRTQTKGLGPQVAPFRPEPSSLSFYNIFGKKTGQNLEIISFYQCCSPNLHQFYIEGRKVSLQGASCKNANWVHLCVDMSGILFSPA
jgi:hypothetical protein